MAHPFDCPRVTAPAFTRMGGLRQTRWATRKQWSSITLVMIFLSAVVLPAAAQDLTRAPIRISDTSVQEGKPADNSPAVFRVQLERPALSQVTVSYVTKDAAATAADVDYQPVSGQLRWEPGELIKQVEVNVIGDYKIENSEDFLVILSNPSPNSFMIDSQGRGIVENDDEPPVFSVTNVSVNEGDSGNTSADFTISLDHPQTQTATVGYATQDGTATLADDDYQKTTGTATFPPGITTFAVSVPVNGDSAPEPDESFPLLLDVTQRDDQPAGGIATIVDDDGGPENPGILTPPNLTGSLPNLVPGGGGVFLTNHQPTLGAIGFPGAYNNPPGAQNIIKRSVAYVTRGKVNPRILLVYDITFCGPAYSYPDGGLFSNCAVRPALTASGFPPCPTTAATAPVTGPCHDVAADNSPEPGAKDLKTIDFRGYDVVLVPNLAAYASGPGYRSTLEALNRRGGELVKYVNEGGGIVGTAPNFGYLPDIKSRIYNGTPPSSRVTPFGRHDVGLTDADVNGNHILGVFVEAGCYEPVDVNERGEIISMATRQTLPCGAPGPHVYASIFDGEVLEGDEGISHLALEVRLSAPLPVRVTVDYAVSDRTAKAQSDYLTEHSAGAPAARGTISFEPEDTWETLRVPVAGDTAVEGDETFAVELSNAVNAGIALPVAIGTILDDDTLAGMPDGKGRAQDAASSASEAGTNPGALPAAQPPSQTQPLEQGAVQGQAAQLQGGVQAQPQLQGAAQLNPAQQIQSQLAQQRSEVLGNVQPALGAEKQSERRPQIETIREGGSHHLASALQHLVPSAALMALAMLLSFPPGSSKGQIKTRHIVTCTRPQAVAGKPQAGRNSRRRL